MASNYRDDSDEGSNHSSESCSGFSDSDTDSEAATNSASDTEETAQTSVEHDVCIYYNRGNCRLGDKCRKEHICSYFLKGSCKYGAGCHLNHNIQSSPSGQSKRASGASSADTDEEWDGPYRWQLNFGRGWENITHDHILEAQYSLPSTKGIKIYNTHAGVISIDFTKMRVLKKRNIKVRRMSSKDTEWLWYYRGENSWYQYGRKGKRSPIQSSELETAYKSNQRGSVKFGLDSAQYEISFKGMCQTNLSTGHKRRVRRRPKYEPSQNGGLHGLTSHLKTLLSPSTNKTPVWQFKGKNQWYTFNKTGGCSVSSADIESCYKSQKTMNFTVNNDTYTLDFAKMCQINQRTKAERKIRRI
ncbi:protein mono-ADP-ribosyltransferase PARP12 [Pseudorasbora parva]|uniref:protein mono-ADP-ribosyltransferase PARP12 n=1 Tax=Pseudorasbora parva TaxID=51549 RepID=UPI00351DF1A8